MQHTVVIGAGTMGGGIAADLAAAGFVAHLLDVDASVAAAGKARLLARKPSLVYTPAIAERILPGAVDDLSVCADALWVVEAVAEQRDVKRALLGRLADVCGARTWVTSNTSGLSLSAMSEGLPGAFRARFFGTHFLNPPRYLKLLEVIPTSATDPARVAEFVDLAEARLGHRVVVAKDTPGFISTRLWITHLLDTIHTAIEMEMDVETVDALTGPFLGRPRSATFRMADVVGLDIIAAVAAHQRDALPGDPMRDRLVLPEPLLYLLETGRLGEKSGAGFYKRGNGQILALDLRTHEYRPRREVVPGSHPRHEVFVARIENGLTEYIRQIGDQIADDPAAIDAAMRWGFGWEIGPIAHAARCHGQTPPPETVAPEYVRPDDLPVITPSPSEERTPGGGGRGAGAAWDTATLRDAGDSALCLELHAKLNVFSPAMCDALVAAIERAEADNAALVVIGQGAQLSAGYDLSRLVSAMNTGDLALIDADMKQCQEAFLRVKYARIPVVVAAHGWALGAGCELCLHARSVIAARETFLGLPECSVGVIPCGGGVKETLLRQRDPSAALWSIVDNKNSDSAFTAFAPGRLRDSIDQICANPDRLLFTALAEARARLGDDPPVTPEPFTPRPGTLAKLRGEIETRRRANALTDHDAFIADAIARIIAADDATVDERALLLREREMFLQLAAHPLSIARMHHLLDTGKPLKN